MKDLKAALKKAYEDYKNNWIKANIDSETMCDTEALYENCDEISNSTSFTEYIECYGFSDGSKYSDFIHWLTDTFA